MTPLQTEQGRLYPPATEDGVRTLVLELALPASWDALGRAWQGVQADLALPAPAIAVSGDDGLQLWFALARPVAPAAGAAFLEALRMRYLPDVRPAHVRARTSAPAVPPVSTGPERWSAFVTPDLASVFADTPWLDVAPGEEGQAAILRALQPIAPAAFETALVRLGAHRRDEAPAPADPAAAARAPVHADPVRFLARVMNDESAPLALRVDAAKALLAHGVRS
ncbi:MAG: hypothetical protein ACTHL8_07670 [Burkholderiaceae bacterium]